MIDTYIRGEVQQLQWGGYVMEPSTGFARKVVDHAMLYEKQRRARVNTWFAIVALAPFAIRELWSLVRHDYISVEHLPLGHLITQAYGVFMSSFALYALIAGGLLLATFVVGLPHWHTARK